MKITDKMRLDWLQRIADSTTPGGWWSVNYDGGIVREDSAGDKDAYYGEAKPTLRAAIDSAIQATSLPRGFRQSRKIRRIENGK